MIARLKTWSVFFHKAGFNNRGCGNGSLLQNLIRNGYKMFAVLI